MEEASLTTSVMELKHGHGTYGGVRRVVPMMYENGSVDGVGTVIHSDLEHGNGPSDQSKSAKPRAEAKDADEVAAVDSLKREEHKEGKYEDPNDGP